MGTTAVVLVAAAAGPVAGGAVAGLKEENEKGSFQKPEELPASALTTSAVLRGRCRRQEAFEFPRLQQAVSQQLIPATYPQSIGLEVVPESDHKDDHPSHSG